MIEDCFVFRNCIRLLREELILDLTIWSAHMVDSNEVYDFNRRSIIFEFPAHGKLAFSHDIDMLE